MRDGVVGLSHGVSQVSSSRTPGRRRPLLRAKSPCAQARIRSTRCLAPQIKRLRDRQARYKEYFATCDDGIVAVDLAGHVVDCNSAYLRLLGYESLDELRGKTIWELTPIEYHQVKGSGYHTTFEHAEVAQYQQEYYRKSGDRLPIAIRSWPRRNRHGRVIGAWAIVRDQTQTRLLDDVTDILARQRLLGELAAAINHEVRNPLTTVRGFLQFFAGDKSFSDRHHELFCLMISELDNAVQIIGDLLSLARPAGPIRRTFSFSGLMGSVVAIIESMAFLRRVTIQADIGEGLYAHGDSAQIRQVILHLVQNSLEAMPEGGLLFIETSREGEKVAVRIIDTGAGIPQELQARLTRPFFTTKAGHTGLGLASCERILSNHQGSIEVESQLGSGTVVRVMLPAASEADLAREWRGGSLSG